MPPRQIQETALSPEQAAQIREAQREASEKQERTRRIEADHQLRVRCVEQAIRARTAGDDAPVVDIALSIYEFLSSWDVDRFEDHK